MIFNRCYYKISQCQHLCQCLAFIKWTPGPISLYLSLCCPKIQHLMRESFHYSDKDFILFFLFSDPQLILYSVYQQHLLSFVCVVYCQLHQNKKKELPCFDQPWSVSLPVESCSKISSKVHQDVVENKMFYTTKRDFLFPKDCFSNSLFHNMLVHNFYFYFILAQRRTLLNNNSYLEDCFKSCLRTELRNYRVRVLLFTNILHTKYEF